MVEEVEQVESSTGTTSSRGLRSGSHPVKLSEISGDAEERVALPIGEFARVLGGGMVPGSIVLVGGDPGIGKSTLLLQMALEMAARSQGAVCLRRGIRAADQNARLRLLRERRTRPTKVRPVACPKTCFWSPRPTWMPSSSTSQVKPTGLVIVDSIQTIYLPEWNPLAGSVTQVRECASRLRELAKSSGIAVFLIGHVTKEGTIAGPRVLEHIVDTVLYLEGDRFQSYRLLRSVKNRFGATSEVGVFEMRERGMVEVTNPSEAFLAERMVNAPARLSP